MDKSLDEYLLSGSPIAYLQYEESELFALKIIPSQSWKYSIKEKMKIYSIRNIVHRACYLEHSKEMPNIVKTTNIGSIKILIKDYFNQI